MCTEQLRLQRTVASIQMCVPEPFNLVLLANCADKAVLFSKEWLRNITLLVTERALGSPFCFNRLITYDNSDVIIFLESGSIVTHGWLDELLDVLKADPSHGLAGPSTNQAWNEQRLHDAPDAEAPPHEVEAFAAQIAHRNKGKYQSLEPFYYLFFDLKHITSNIEREDQV